VIWVQSSGAEFNLPSSIAMAMLIAYREETNNGNSVECFHLLWWQLVFKHRSLVTKMRYDTFLSDFKEHEPRRSVILKL
jgi:predicted membrane chloride channel (bestrophin family)